MKTILVTGGSGFIKSTRLTDGIMYGYHIYNTDVYINNYWKE